MTILLLRETQRGQGAEPLVRAWERSPIGGTLLGFGRVISSFSIAELLPQQAELFPPFADLLHSSRPLTHITLTSLVRADHFPAMCGLLPGPRALTVFILEDP